MEKILVINPGSTSTKIAFYEAEKEVWKDRSLDFEGICRSLGADPASLDREIFDELGFRGQQVLDLYRGLFPNK